MKTLVPIELIATKIYLGEYLAHYYLSVNAMTQPMMVREDQASYGGEKS